MTTDSAYSYRNHLDEPADPCSEQRLEVNGAYLLVQWGDHPLHIYRALMPGERVHYAVEQIEHEGQPYCLMWIEDDKEHSQPY
ncbi:MAG: hypothetical protein HC876_06055 [Chloroflexaceae bacterium]|nr:hypothetical protein [Chloroflexaceae bacterium]